MPKRKSEHSLRHWTREALYDTNSHSFFLVNDFFAIITLVSIAGLILETVSSLYAYMGLFRAIEFLTVFFFSLEYAARVATEEKKLKYMFSFFGLIDLIAILPTFIGLVNLTFLKSVRILRILRFLRMARLAKIARIQHHIADIEDYAHLYKLNIGIYFFGLFSAITVFGSLMYIVEGGDQNFQNIPEGMLWAAENILGGSEQLPVTSAGKLTAIAARFAGLVLFGLLISVVGNIVNKVLFGTKKV